ncbi:3-carboxyethylcatechol 2,3-dioxygenase [Nocardioides sp. CBS4Y-1]|uniref:2,3-dihydroxyphenylpropionate/2,3-dihydroxicinnamic acid 1,2-dioxygenase n=2 Tax=Nocardioides acrostichi TaxID=2784339 RepID=A0A930Y8H1_9ACTN|nr:3-carboxyethylcatechol 2,3-dioxygenase [Nocardioides acrostichi]
MSHTPLLGKVEVAADVTAELDAHVETLRAEIERFDPTVIVLFAPDHYNGFFYDIMPPFCIGTAARAIGDFGSAEGDLSVPAELAQSLAQGVMDAGFDTAISRGMEVDHGAVQPLELLFGGLSTRPVVPVFVNGVAVPLTPMERIRGFGAAVGRHLATTEERVLYLASGGLSHDPPVPQWADADDQARAFLLAGRHPTTQARAARESRVFATAEAFSQGAASIRDLNPTWDQAFLESLAAGDLATIGGYDPEEMTRVAGHSAHEVRTWLAAFGALQAAGGDYSVVTRYYRPIREYIAGFGILSAAPLGSAPSPRRHG